MKILYVAWMAPYDKVRHAGGQTFNYYIRGMASTDNEITLMCFCSEEEELLIDTSKTGIKTIPLIRRKNLKDKLANIQSIASKVDPKHKYCNLLSRKSAQMMLREITALKNTGYKPDVIILEWTEMLLLIDDIKEIYPEAKYVASEHDVTFQRIEREAADGSRRKYIQARNTKERELAAIRKCDKVIVHNRKDKKLLIDNEISEDKIHVIVPYYHRSKMPYHRENNKILFFGNMYRKENKEASEWFAEKVVPLMRDVPCDYDVIGNGARYVDSIDDEFSKAMCFVCPMIHGAGIKVKNIEALYAGLPVLTNSVGIEGIPATDKKEYIHCETPEEYANAIRRIYLGELTVDGSQCIKNHFDMDESLRSYREMINKIANE